MVYSFVVASHHSILIVCPPHMSLIIKKKTNLDKTQVFDH